METDMRCFFCPNIAKFKCPKCEMVLFCSEDHGLLHIRDEVGTCFPYRVVKKDLQFTTSKNEFYASKDIKKGEVIMMQDPVIMGPFGDLSEDAMCLSCLDPLDIEVCQTCPGCGYPMCEKCLDNPSHSHRQECSLLTVLMRHTDDFMAVTIIRLLMLKYINSGLFKMLVSFVNRDKTGRNIELKNKGSLITAIVEGFNEYWSLQEIQSAIEVVESRSELVQQYTNITKSSSDKNALFGSVGIYHCQVDQDSVGPNCKNIYNKSAPAILVALKDIRRNEKLLLQPHVNTLR